MQPITTPLRLSWRVIRAILYCIAISFLLTPPVSVVNNLRGGRSSSFLSDFSEHMKRAIWVSVQGGFSLPIAQQPENKGIYVTNKIDLITQFGKPAQNGVTALLAHNYRSGIEFYTLNIGQLVTVMYEGGFVHNYQVVSISSFQKLNRASIYSDLIDLNTKQELSSTEVYNRFYRGSHHVIFQTCLKGDGYLDWGLYFVVAVPVEQSEKNQSRVIQKVEGRGN